MMGCSKTPCVTADHMGRFIVVGGNRDIVASRQAFVGTRNTQLRMGTVPGTRDVGHTMMTDDGRGRGASVEKIAWGGRRVEY